MAAPAFVQAGAGIVVQTGNADMTLASAVAGNIVILQALEDGTTGLGPDLTFTFTNVEALDGTDSSMTGITAHISPQGTVGSPIAALQYVRIGRVMANGTVTVNMATSANDGYARLYEFSGVHTGSALADVIENGTAGSHVNGAGTSATIADSGVTTLGADRLAINLVAVNDDNALDAFTGMTGGTWAEATAEYLTATGTDGAIGLQTATIASAGTIDGGTDSMGISDAWGVVGFALIPAAAALRALAYDDRRVRRNSLLRR